MQNNIKGNFFLLLTAIAWGTGFVARKLGNAVIPAVTFNGLRQLGAAIVLLPLMLYGLKKSGYLSKEKNSKKRLAFHRYKVVVGGLVCGMFLTFASTLQSLGLVTVSAGKSGFITALYIVITPIFSLVFGNRIKKKTYVCIAMAIVGFGFLSLNGGIGNVNVGDWMLLGGAACFAAQIVAINKFVDKSNDLILSVIQMGLCGILELAVAIPLEHPTMEQFMSCIPALVYAILVPSALGYTLQIVGQKYTSSTAAALIMSLESVFSVIFGAIILHEYMLPREILGCVIIFAAVILNQIEIKKKPKQ